MITDFTIRAQTSLNMGILRQQCFEHFKELGYVPNWNNRSHINQRVINVNLNGQNIAIYEYGFDIEIVKFN